MKVIAIRKVLKDKTYLNYYLVLENGTYIAIKPSFVNDYAKLRAVCSSIDDEKK